MRIDPDLIEQTKGFLSAEEGEALFGMALEAAARGPCLEIGSYCGRSTLYLGAACRECRSILFAVDHHCGSEEQQPGEAYFDPALHDPRTGRIDTFPTFRDTLRKADLEQTVVPIVTTSAVAARQWATPLSLVFIDGGHALETVQADYGAWAPHLMARGLLIFHDIYKDPAQGGQAPYQVYQQALASGDFEVRGMVGSLGILQRT
jgi:predicted O-methyltransferase YrrM